MRPENQALPPHTPVGRTWEPFTPVPRGMQNQRNKSLVPSSPSSTLLESESKSGLRERFLSSQCPHWSVSLHKQVGKPSWMAIPHLARPPIHPPPVPSPSQQPALSLLDLPEFITVTEDQVHMLVKSLEGPDEDPTILQDASHPVVNVLQHLAALTHSLQERSTVQWGSALLDSHTSCPPPNLPPLPNFLGATFSTMFS